MRTLWVLLLLLGCGCAAGYGDGSGRAADDDSGSDNTVVESDTGVGGWVVGDSGVAESDSGSGGWVAGDSGPPPCQPSCVGKTCGSADGCGGTCQAGSGCSALPCQPSCAGKICGAADGCGGTCQAGSGCCTPDCAGKACGSGDGCGGTCKIGGGCVTSCGTWQAVNPDDPWDDPDPNYDGERGCDGALVKDFGTVSLEASCRTKCEKVAATCCQRDHRSGQKSCKAYGGKVIVKSGCTGCTAASCK